MACYEYDDHWAHFSFADTINSHQHVTRFLTRFFEQLCDHDRTHANLQQAI